MKKYIVPVTAILAITVIEVFALTHNINGTIMSASVATVAGICGYWIKAIRK